MTSYFSNVVLGDIYIVWDRPICHRQLCSRWNDLVRSFKVIGDHVVWRVSINVQQPWTMSISCTVFKIQRFTFQKSRILLYLTYRLTLISKVTHYRNFGMYFWENYIYNDGAIMRWKTFDHTFNHLDTIPEQDRRLATTQTARAISIASRG